MHVKIYFNDRPLFLCDSNDETAQKMMQHDDAVFIDELNVHTIKTMIHEMQQPHVRAGVFSHSDLDELIKAFKKKFVTIRAAGGLVRNESGSVLMIFRRGKWDLPKGKLDEGERIEDCAMREVKEETGLKKVTLLSPLTTTYHTYHEGTNFLLKESHWFTMDAAGEQVLTPQAEEDITGIQWVGPADIDKMLTKTFPLIHDILDAARQAGFIAF